MAGPHTPDIRGDQREELVQDLATGSLTHTQLAEKYSRHPQAIAQCLAHAVHENCTILCVSHELSFRLPWASCG
jgi:hypothetical protein